MYQGIAHFRHQLVAPLPEHQQHQQRVERQLQWQLRDAERQQHLWGPAGSDGKTSTSNPHGRKQSIYHQRGLYPIHHREVGGWNDTLCRCRGPYGITGCLYGAIWRHTITALRGRGRPLLRDGGPPSDLQWQVHLMRFAPSRCFTKHTLQQGEENGKS